MSTVSRKILFFRADIGEDDAGRPLDFDPTSALSHIDELPFDDAGRYVRLPDDRRICCWVDSRLTPPWRLQLGVVRRSALPLLERGGKLSGLQLPDLTGLVETTHIVIFPENLVGVEFNFYGPRVSRLSPYLQERGNGECPIVQFEHLFAAEPAARLQRFGTIKSMALRLRPSPNNRADIDFIDAIGPLGAEVADIEVIMRATPDAPLLSGRGLTSRAIQFLERKDVAKFWVFGTNRDTGVLESLNLLDAQLAVQKRIEAREDGRRAVSTPAAYQAIGQARDEIRAEIADAWRLSE